MAKFPKDSLAAAAQSLVDAVSFDVNGALIGQTYMGGNGGLVSRDTLAKADAVRRALARLEEPA
jgi:hypothetical protein